jgi:hypothetical protein
MDAYDRAELILKDIDHRVASVPENEQGTVLEIVCTELRTWLEAIQSGAGWAEPGTGWTQGR